MSFFLLRLRISTQMAWQQISLVWLWHYFYQVFGRDEIRTLGLSRPQAEMGLHYTELTFSFFVFIQKKLFPGCIFFPHQTKINVVDTWLLKMHKYCPLYSFWVLSCVIESDHFKTLEYFRVISDHVARTCSFYFSFPLLQWVLLYRSEKDNYLFLIFW